MNEDVLLQEYWLSVEQNDACAKKTRSRGDFEEAIWHRYSLKMDASEETEEKVVTKGDKCIQPHCRNTSHPSIEWLMQFHGAARDWGIFFEVCVILIVFYFWGCQCCCCTSLINPPGVVHWCLCLQSNLQHLVKEEHNNNLNMSLAEWCSSCSG